MEKICYMVLFSVCMSTAVLAQNLQTTVTASANGEHVYVAIGQPFFQQLVVGEYELSMGIAQAQWTRDTVYDVITYNTPYMANQFTLPAQTDSHVDSTYLVNGGIYNYDLLRTLYLIVCPQKVADYYSTIMYDVLAVSGHCWTKQNLRSPVEGAMSYTSLLHPSIPEEYGLLYTWYTAANAAPDGTITLDANGYVQGICPINWHIPDAAEIGDLNTNISESLRSVDGWVLPNNNTNSTGFTAYPAGRFNAALNRFEGFGTETDWWTTVNASTFGVATSHETSLQIPYYCDTPLLIPRLFNDGMSVRCVMINDWDF